jgi:hypothetical protein
MRAKETITVLLWALVFWVCFRLDGKEIEK